MKIPAGGFRINAPASVAATIGRDTIACGKLTTSSPSKAPSSAIGSASSRVTWILRRELREAQPRAPTGHPAPSPPLLRPRDREAAPLRRVSEIRNEAFRLDPPDGGCRRD